MRLLIIKMLIIFISFIIMIQSSFVKLQISSMRLLFPLFANIKLTYLTILMIHLVWIIFNTYNLIIVPLFLLILIKLVLVIKNHNIASYQVKGNWSNSNKMRLLKNDWNYLNHKLDAYSKLKAGEQELLFLKYFNFVDKLIPYQLKNSKTETLSFYISLQIMRTKGIISREDESVLKQFKYYRNKIVYEIGFKFQIKKGYYYLKKSKKIVEKMIKRS